MLNMEPTLAVSGILAGAGAAAYLLLGFRLAGRAVQPEQSAAWRLYSVWWICVGTLLLVSSTAMLAASAGLRDPVFYAVQAHLERLILCIGLWCVLGYFSYLHLGSTKLWVPLALFYAALWLQMSYQVILAGPPEAVFQPWARPRLVEADIPRAQQALVRLLVFVPPLVGIALNLRLARFSQPAARRRLLAASAAIVVWFVIPGFAHFYPGEPLLQVTSRITTLAAGIALLLVYRPMIAPERGNDTAPPGVHSP